MVERETGIERALVAWKATVLPLNYSRTGRPCLVAPPAGKAVGYRETGGTDGTGGGRWMAAALRALALRAAPSGALSKASPCCRTSGGSHPPPARTLLLPDT